MSLSDLASLGSFVSGVAVLVTLVLLLLQMRQSSLNQRALMSQGNIDRIGDIVRWLAEPHMAALISRVSEGETKFTNLELTQLNLRLRHTIISVQDAYVHHRAGLLDPIGFEQSLIALRATLSVPAYRALWKITRQGYAPEMIALVEREIAGTPITGPLNLLEPFNLALAEIAQ